MWNREEHKESMIASSRVMSKTMTLPLPAPTIAANPTIATEGAVKAARGRMAPAAVAEAPPNLANEVV